MAFYMADYSSEEKFDISKFLDYQENTYDVIASPFLAQLSQLPTVNYYYVDNGYRDIDLIATQAYGDPLYAYLIQYYNNCWDTVLPEGSMLKLFSIEALNELYADLYNKKNLGE